MTDEAKTVAPEKLFESDEFKAALTAIVVAAVTAALNEMPVLTTDALKSYLDENLPDLVAAAMPETPEAKADRERKERAQASADAAEAKAQEDAAKAAEEAESVKEAERQRKAEKKRAEKAFKTDAKIAAAQVREQVDYVKLIDLDADYVILADDGTTYCIDFGPDYDPKLDFDIQKDRGVSIKIPVEVSGLQERFSFARLTLRKAGGGDSPILRNEIVQPFWAGDGRKADFPANSLLFRVIA